MWDWLCMKDVKASFSHSYFLELHCCKRSSVVFVQHIYTVYLLLSFVQGGFCSDVSRDVCYCAWNKESAPQRIGRVTFPLFLLGLWKAICWRRGILCFNACTITVEFNYRCIFFLFFFFSFGRGCLILKALILNGMEIDSINCMCGGMKDKEKWNVTEEASF